MKSLIVMLALSLWVPVQALAQGWETYTYSNPGFSIQFPTAPTLGSRRIKNSLGISLPLTQYTVTQDHTTYTLSVVDYSNTNADALSTIAETARTFTASGEVTATTGTRVNGSHGRKMSVTGADGTRSSIAIFFVDKHLYTAIGQSLPPNAIQNSGEAIRFRDSLQFLDEGGTLGSIFHGSRSAQAPATTPATRPSEPYRPKTDATCAGKSAGDSVQLETPGGPVAATCTLVARPNTPPT